MPSLRGGRVTGSRRLAETATRRFFEPMIRTSHSPPSGKSKRKRNSAASSLRQDAYKLNNICGRCLSYPITSSLGRCILRS